MVVFLTELVEGLLQELVEGRVCVDLGERRVGGEVGGGFDGG